MRDGAPAPAPSRPPSAASSVGGVGGSSSASVAPAAGAISRLSRFRRCRRRTTTATTTRAATMTTLLCCVSSSAAAARLVVVVAASSPPPPFRSLPSPATTAAFAFPLFLPFDPARRLPPPAPRRPFLLPAPPPPPPPSLRRGSSSRLSLDLAPKVAATAAGGGAEAAAAAPEAKVGDAEKATSAVDGATMRRRRRKTGTTIVPPPGPGLNRASRQCAMNEMYRLCAESKNEKRGGSDQGVGRATKAADGDGDGDVPLRLLERLLEDEARTGNTILKRGAVYNVLKVCQRPNSLWDGSSTAGGRERVDRLEKVLCLLERNERLWERKMISFASVAMERNSDPERAEALRDRLRNERDDSRKDGGGGDDDDVRRRKWERDDADGPSSRGAGTGQKKGRGRRPPRPTLDSEDAKAKADSALRSSVGSLDDESTRGAVDALRFYARGGGDVEENDDDGRGERARKALLLLTRLLKEEEERPEPRVLTRGTAFRVLRLCQRNDAVRAGDVERAVTLLENRRAKVDGDDNLWDAKVLREALVAIATCGSRDGPDRAEATLDRIQTVRPNAHHYRAVLDGHAKAGNGRKAERVLKRMEELRRVGYLDSDDGPDVVSYNIALDALSKCRESYAVERAETTLRKLETDPSVRPDFVTYTNVLNLYAKRGEGGKAERLLDRMINAHRSGELEVRPNERTYRAAIAALADGGEPDRAEELLRRMLQTDDVRPNKFHYCAILSGYAKLGRAEEAERLLRRMRTSRDSGAIADGPNAVAYNCVAHAWSKSDDDDAPTRILDLLDRMADDDGVSPDVVTYNCLLAAYGNRGMAKETERLLKRMRDLHASGDLESPPNAISHNCVLGALARSGDRVWTVLRAESIVNAMKELNESGDADAEPNVSTYRNLLKCYINWKMLDDAERLIFETERMHAAGKLERKPDRFMYLLVVDALEKSNEDDGPERARALSKRMERMHGRATTKDDAVGGGWHQETLIEVDQVDALLEYMSE